eukprot:6183690-Pleurochrysis_carterae.AAC.1
MAVRERVWHRPPSGLRTGTTAGRMRHRPAVERQTGPGRGVGRDRRAMGLCVAPPLHAGT